MSKLEIPLLRESAAFSKRLIAASLFFHDSKYQFYRRVNWSHRYEEGFYRFESECFQKDPDAYLSGAQEDAPKLEDVFQQKIRWSQLVKVVLKVIAHWIFRLLGGFVTDRNRRSGILIYRKAYVDDIELVFDPEEVGVIRAVYPFPLSIRRQWRYLCFLRKKGCLFKLAGNPYQLKDLAHVLWRRNVKSVQRLESRAQIRHAYEVLDLRISDIQLSDEFEMGSFDFVRVLSRYPVNVVNSAHGVGKYLPIHAYPTFFILTHRQEEYYYAIRKCKYRIRSLNVRINSDRPAGASDISLKLVRVVYLGQTFPGVNDVITESESRILDRLIAAFGSEQGVGLYYKPHPTSKGDAVPPGFLDLEDINSVNDLEGTIFVSLFSTCQIDPNFRGRKVLVRGNLIHPEIAFDESEEIVSIDELITLIDGARRDVLDAHAESLWSNA